MMQEIVEGKWIDSFQRVLTLNGVKNGTVVAILAETQSRPVMAQLAALACHNLKAQYATIILPTPANTAPVPVKSTGCCDAIQHMPHVVEALKAADIVVDVTVEGLLHAEEWPAIEAAGTRLLTICNEHPEILERTEPTKDLEAKVNLGIKLLRQAKIMRVTSKAGTDLTINLTDAPCGGTPGFTTSPGGVAHWPGGICLAFPGKHTVNGTIVMDVGDMNLTFKQYLRDQVTLIVDNDYVTDIQGANLDADLFREYIAAWNDTEAYGFSHVGFGVNTAARWEAMALYDKGDVQATEFRAWAGNFLFSTGSNQYAGRFTLGHFDLPMRHCTITLDDLPVVVDGRLVGELAE